MAVEETMSKYCVTCSGDVNPNRWALGYRTCLSCGEKSARQVKQCIVPLAKSNYVPITDPNVLKQLNKYANH